MTGISLLPSAWALLDVALRARRPVSVSYHGRRRVVCPHALGWNKTRPLVLSYQTGGQTTTGTLDADPHKRWRCMYVDEIDQVLPTAPDSPWGTADNYNPSDPSPAIDHVAIAIPRPSPPHS
ncbi:MAG: hypothetical protein ACRD0J_17910 [Acidimicrobiales bacterium]